MDGAGGWLDGHDKLDTREAYEDAERNNVARG